MCGASPTPLLRFSWTTMTEPRALRRIRSLIKSEQLGFDACQSTRCFPSRPEIGSRCRAARFCEIVLMTASAQARRSLPLPKPLSAAKRTFAAAPRASPGRG